ncbi:hypothetical protein L218DRAFT_994112 [Marasmius fiardii PR-910]|nr:hypothetical protein L218DRAFT_994112 [Marasmius fiardii PR-910]
MLGFMEMQRVHRDVSSWNALWDPKTKTGRLADYDYVTEYGKQGTGTVKTMSISGTPHFWSVEVEAGQYLYQPDSAPPSQEGQLLSVTELASHLQPLVFHHNLLHDLESIYWVSLWTMLWLVGDEDWDNGEAKKKRKLLAQKVFSVGPPVSQGERWFERERFIQNKEYRAKIFKEYGADGISSEILLQIIFSFHFVEIPMALKSQFTDLQVKLTDADPLPSHDDPVFKRAFDAMKTSLKNLWNQQKTNKLLESRVRPVYTFQVTLDKEDEPQKLDKPIFYPNQSEDEEPDDLDDTAGPPDSKRPKLDGADQPSAEGGTGSSV